MPRVHRDEPLPCVILCAALTMDGKLADDPPIVPPILYGGDADPKRHPWAALYDRAAAILIDDHLRDSLPMPQAAIRPLISVPRHAIGGAADWQRETRVALSRLREGGQRENVLCFGGEELFRALLDAGLVREILLAVRPRIDGRRDAATLSGPPGAAFFPASIACRLLAVEMRAGECLLRYRVD